jgi:hypothetical protein
MGATEQIVGAFFAQQGFVQVGNEALASGDPVLRRSDPLRPFLSQLVTYQVDADGQIVWAPVRQDSEQRQGVAAAGPFRSFRNLLEAEGARPAGVAAFEAEWLAWGAAASAGGGVVGSAPPAPLGHNFSVRDLLGAQGWSLVAVQADVLVFKAPPAGDRRYDSSIHEGPNRESFLAVTPTRGRVLQFKFLGEVPAQGTAFEAMPNRVFSVEEVLVATGLKRSLVGQELAGWTSWTAHRLEPINIGQVRLPWLRPIKGRPAGITAAVDFDQAKVFGETLAGLGYQHIRQPAGAIALSVRPTDDRAAGSVTDPEGGSPGEWVAWSMTGYGPRATLLSREQLAAARSDRERKPSFFELGGTALDLDNLAALSRTEISDRGLAQPFRQEPPPAATTPARRSRKPAGVEVEGQVLWAPSIARTASGDPFVRVHVRTDDGQDVTAVFWGEQIGALPSLDRKCRVRLRGAELRPIAPGSDGSGPQLEVQSPALAVVKRRSTQQEALVGRQIAPRHACSPDR